MTTSTETRPWQAQIIEQLADADTENATHIVIEVAGDTPILREITDNEQHAIERASAIAVETENEVEVKELAALYNWHKEQLEVKLGEDNEQPPVDEPGDPTPADPTDEQPTPEPDPDTGKLFDVPRVTVITDDADPTLLLLAFSGSIKLDRSIANDVAFYNRLRSGKSVYLELEAHVAGATKRHRRDKEGDVDAIVETKSLVITDVATA